MMLWLFIIILLLFYFVYVHLLKIQMKNEYISIAFDSIVLWVEIVCLHMQNEKGFKSKQQKRIINMHMRNAHALCISVFLLLPFGFTCFQFVFVQKHKWKRIIEKITDILCSLCVFIIYAYAERWTRSVCACVCVFVRIQNSLYSWQWKSACARVSSIHSPSCFPLHFSCLSIWNVDRCWGIQWVIALHALQRYSLFFLFYFIRKIGTGSITAQQQLEHCELKRFQTDACWKWKWKGREIDCAE